MIAGERNRGKNVLTNQILDDYISAGHIEQMDLFMRINEFLIANNLMNGLMSQFQKISTNCMCNGFQHKEMKCIRQK